MSKTSCSIKLLNLSAAENDPLRQMPPKCNWATRRVKEQVQKEVRNMNHFVLNSFWVRSTWTSEKKYVHNVGTGRHPEIKT